MTEEASGRPIRCVGGLAYDGQGRLLLVQRANEPGRGMWSVPGGRVEPGEDDAAALVREMQEETGLLVQPGELVGRVRRGPFDIGDYRCTVLGGTLRPATTPPTPAGATPPSWPRCRWSTSSWKLCVTGMRYPADGWGRPGCSPPRASP